MKVELKDLSFIDGVAATILSSRLISSQTNLTRDHIYSLADSAYTFAKVVFEVREAFKKENDIIEEEYQWNIHPLDMAITQNLKVLEEAQEVLTQIVEQQGLKAVAKKAPTKEIPVVEETKVENKQPKKRGRPKSALKVNTVLIKKTK
jgi:hypothetical protein